MKEKMEKLIKHLKTQISVADSLDSQFVYITKNEAKKCLELAEAEDDILDSLNGIEPVEIDSYDHPGTKEWHCGNCDYPLWEDEYFCAHCGKKIKEGIIK